MRPLLTQTSSSTRRPPRRTRTFSILSTRRSLGFPLKLCREILFTQARKSCEGGVRSRRRPPSAAAHLPLAKPLLLLCMGTLRPHTRMQGGRSEVARQHGSPGVPCPSAPHRPPPPRPCAWAPVTRCQTLAFRHLFPPPRRRKRVAFAAPWASVLHPLPPARYEGLGYAPIIEPSSPHLCVTVSDLPLSPNASAPSLHRAHPPSEVLMTRMTWRARARGAAFCRAARLNCVPPPDFN